MIIELRVFSSNSGSESAVCRGGVNKVMLIRK